MSANVATTALSDEEKAAIWAEVDAILPVWQPLDSGRRTKSAATLALEGEVRSQNQAARNAIARLVEAAQRDARESAGLVTTIGDLRDTFTRLASVPGVAAQIARALDADLTPEVTVITNDMVTYQVGGCSVIHTLSSRQVEVSLYPSRLVFKLEGGALLPRQVAAIVACFRAEERPDDSGAAGPAD